MWSELGNRHTHTHTHWTNTYRLTPACPLPFWPQSVRDQETPCWLQAARWRCAHGLYKTVPLNFLLREIYTCCVLFVLKRCAVLFLFPVEVSKCLSPYLNASLTSISSKSDTTISVEYCNKVAFRIKQNQMKDIPLTPGCTVFSAGMIKADGTNED